MEVLQARCRAWTWTRLPSVWSPGQGEGARRATVLMMEAKFGGMDPRGAGRGGVGQGQLG